jgi:ubiquinone/menaquinone biosynthesis C-methylase UbiE
MNVEELPKRLALSNAGKIAKKLRSVSGGRVLDVATGDGEFIDTLMQTLEDYDSFVGIDYCASDESRKHMESAKKRLEGKPVRFFEINAESLKFQDESFDTVCISHSLHHLANIGKVLAEMKRVLKRGVISYFRRITVMETRPRHRKHMNVSMGGWQRSIPCLALPTIKP